MLVLASASLLQLFVASAVHLLWVECCRVCAVFRGVGLQQAASLLVGRDLCLQYDDELLDLLLPNCKQALVPISAGLLQVFDTCWYIAL